MPSRRDFLKLTGLAIGTLALPIVGATRPAQTRDGRYRLRFSIDTSTVKTLPEQFDVRTCVSVRQPLTINQFDFEWVFGFCFPGKEPYRFTSTHPCANHMLIGDSLQMDYHLHSDLPTLQVPIRACYVTVYARLYGSHAANEPLRTVSALTDYKSLQ